MPAGASGKTIEAVATATITSKAPVGLNADGTVTVIGGSAPVPQTIPDGVAQAYNSSSMNISSIAFDPNTAGEFVIAFIESGVLKAVVGNLSGTTATFGTPVTVNAATTTISFSSAGYNPNVAKQFVIAFIDGTDSNKGKVALGTVASTVITMQSAVTYDAGSTGTEAPPSVAFDPNTSGNFVISYRDSTGHGAALVCSISGTTITANSPTNFTTGWAYGNLINSSCDPNTANKVVIVYQDGRGSDYGKSVVGTVSGTSISFGAINVFESAATQGPSVDYNPATANHFAIAYKGSGEDGKAILGTISGTTITYPDSPVIFATVNAISTNIAFDPNTDDEFVISYDESSNLYIVTGTASATTVALDTPIEIYPTAASYSTTRFNPDSDSAGQFMTSFQDGDAADFGTLRFGQIAATQPKSSADFVGIADAAITSDATFVVTVGGGKFVIDGVSQDTVSLQEGATYTFDQAAGTNSTHPLRFSTTSDGTHGGGSEYTTGVTTNGTPGSAGAYTRIVVASGAPTLYYYCSNHSGMGGTVNTTTGATSFTATGTSSPVTITGLILGQTYTVTVTAINAYGPSATSEASNSFETVKTTAVIYTMGNNANSQLGDGTQTNRSSPVAVGALDTWNTGSGGYRYAFAIRENTLWGWGMGSNGQLGQGDTTEHSSPVQIGALTNWSSVTAGYSLGVAVKTDGTLWSWGNSGTGGLGLGNTTAYSSPKQVGALTDWSTVSSSGNVTAAIKTDGTMWTWGQGYYGQLGLSNTTYYSSPKQVGSLTTWSKVSASWGHSLAIKTDGTLWSMGQNQHGQLGLGDTTNKSSPSQVGALTTWVEAAAGRYFSVAIKSDGTFWAWGQNQYGQLGQGNTTYRSSPVQVGALTTWSTVTVGRANIASVKTDGTLWTWGYNNGGQLGDNSTTTRSSPVQVGSRTNWIRTMNQYNNTTIAI